MLCLKNITKVYSRKQVDDVIALDNVSLNFPEKGFVAILGASGSGKTTLLNIIGGLDTPTSGNLIVDGLSTENFKPKDWDSYRNNKIGFVLQNCYLLPHLNVKDNIAIKLQINRRKSSEIDGLVDEALKKVDLLDKKFDKPKALSGGQKQRVAIARAIIGSPTVILADEPTGALDSKTGTQIMELLKKLSEDHLVVMVTHNNDYASKYADRVIELKDGKVVNDSNPYKVKEDVQGEALNKVSIPASTTVKWGFKNLIIKKYSTLSIIIAASLGLAGVGLILSISSGVQTAFNKAEARAFSKYPVQITTYSKQSPEGSTAEYEQYTDEQSVFADYSGYMKQEHYNYMSNEFLTYMGNMPKSNYYVSYESSYTSFNVFTKVNDTRYAKVSSTGSLFYKGIDNIEFMDDQYDCLMGEFPREQNELALVVDTYNRVDVGYLYTLGFDVNTDEISDVKFSFEEIKGKTYRYVPNNDYYSYDDTDEYYKVKYYPATNSANAKKYYDESTVELKITAILREKKDNSNSLFRSGIIYTPEFEKYVINNAKHSQIVKDQLEAGLSKDMTTGLPFTDTQSSSMNYSKEYNYEQRLYSLGSFERITTLYYFTVDYASRQNIRNYFSNYVTDEQVDFGSLNITDYLEHASVQFDGALKLMTSVLYVFAIVSIIVSAILNAILTYISIHQRTNEIGLLRSLGARKKDIALMVETESIICGTFGGLVSILLSIILIRPLNTLVTKAIYQYNFYLLSQTTFDLGGFQWWVAPILIGLAVLTALISALIPAIIASKKNPAKAINE